MGKKYSKIKEKYENDQFKIVRTVSDNHLLEFEILSFSFNKIELGLKKEINSKNIKLNWESKTILKLFSQMHPNITDFMFMNKNKKNPNKKDLLFEYGVALIKPFKKEKYIWILLDNIIDALIYLEENGLHYPNIRPEYIFQKNIKFYRLLNHYSFPSMLTDIIDVYTNDMIKISERKRYREKKIKVNIRELGCLGLYLMGDFNFDRLIEDSEYVEKSVKKISRFISPQSLSFFGYIFDNGLVGETFKDIKIWFQKNISLRTKKDFKNFYFIDLEKELNRPKKDIMKEQNPVVTNLPLQNDILAILYKDGLEDNFNNDVGDLYNSHCFQNTINEGVFAETEEISPKNFSTSLKYLSHAERVNLKHLQKQKNINPLKHMIKNSKSVTKLDHLNKEKIPFNPKDQFMKKNNNQIFPQTEIYIEEDKMSSNITQMKNEFKLSEGHCIPENRKIEAQKLNEIKEMEIKYQIQKMNEEKEKNLQLLKLKEENERLLNLKKLKDEKDRLLQQKKLRDEENKFLEQKLREEEEKFLLIKEQERQENFKHQELLLQNQEELLRQSIYEEELAKRFEHERKIQEQENLLNQQRFKEEQNYFIYQNQIKEEQDYLMNQKRIKEEQDYLMNQNRIKEEHDYFMNQNRMKEEQDYLMNQNRIKEEQDYLMNQNRIFKEQEAKLMLSKNLGLENIENKNPQELINNQFELAKKTCKEEIKEGELNKIITLDKDEQNKNFKYQNENYNKINNYFQKELKRTVIKINSNNEYEKFNEYQDGYLERIEMTEEEKKKFKQPTITIILETPKKPKTNEEIYFVLDDGNPDLILLNKFQLDNSKYNSYGSLNEIVDYNDNIKPSNYHLIN